MRTVKKFCLLLLSLLTVGCVSTGCQYLPEGFLPDIFGSSENSSDDSEESSSSSASDESDAQRAIMDAAYALATGDSLEGTHTLTGVITSVETEYSSKRGVTLIMEVVGRDMQCYRLTGTGADLIGVGDTITVTGTIKNYKGTVEFDSGKLVSYVLAGGEAPNPDGDPYADVSKAEFYADYSPATSNEDAYYRSLNGLMSGTLTTPDQAPTVSEYRPMQNELYIRNSEMLYEEDGKAYIVVDAYGNEAFRVYEDGAYITLEEVAAYVYAFGTCPANYTASKSTDPNDSVWGEYLRVNHTSFSGDTSRYPYEPKLPNISGCGGDLNYFEMDIGTKGTDCDPSYVAAVYNDGNRIVRGAARIVYAKRDLNRNGVYERGELHVFYTYNHYNDFQEYLNYAGGWGETFGNITGGGTLSSKTDCNPTAYEEVVIEKLHEISAAAVELYYCDPKKFLSDIAYPDLIA